MGTLFYAVKDDPPEVFNLGKWYNVWPGAHALMDDPPVLLPDVDTLAAQISAHYATSLQKAALSEHSRWYAERLIAWAAGAPVRFTSEHDAIFGRHVRTTGSAYEDEYRPDGSFILDPEDEVR